MRYWHPFTEEALASIKADGIERLVVLPLYPQVCFFISLVIIHFGRRISIGQSQSAYAYAYEFDWPQLFSLAQLSFLLAEEFVSVLVRVRMRMRMSLIGNEEALASIKADGIERLVVLSLYPQSRLLISTLIMSRP